MFKISRRRGSLLFSGFLLLGQGFRALLKNPELVSGHIKLVKTLNAEDWGPKYAILATAATIVTTVLEKFQNIISRTNISKDEVFQKLVNKPNTSRSVEVLKPGRVPKIVVACNCGRNKMSRHDRKVSK